MNLAVRYLYVEQTSVQSEHLPTNTIEALSQYGFSTNRADIFVYKPWRTYGMGLCPLDTF